MEPDWNRRAVDLIVDGRYADAREVLDAAIQQMPANWTSQRDEGPHFTIACWDQEEFLAFTHRHRHRKLKKPLFWVAASYSRSWYLLGVIASKQQRYEEALVCLDSGLKLEPDHPELWSEKGFVLARLERFEEALACYRRAASVRDWAPDSQVARALRGQGVTLVDLSRLDEAEAALRESQELEPDSETARRELEYIQDLRRKREEIPWFMHSFVAPPTDPLTIGLIAMAEKLPCLAGPMTIGPDNYSRISKAFLERGWAAFEEEFDRIVPRGRSDYVEVKRDLLREPLFSIVAHRNLADAVLGIRTVDEIFDELKRKKPDQPT